MLENDEIKIDKHESSGKYVTTKIQRLYFIILILKILSKLKFFC